MRIDPESTIAGVPIVAVRDFLRWSRGFEWRDVDLCARMSLAAHEGQALLDELLRLGYVIPSEAIRGAYGLTLLGGTLVNASAAKPVRREVADRRLAEFLERVTAVNETRTYSYCVERVQLFGSMLSIATHVNDIDLVLDLVPRWHSRAEQDQREAERIALARQEGRQFRNIVDEIFWPRQEVMLFLRNRSRLLNFHDSRDQVLAHTSPRTIFERPST